MNIYLLAILVLFIFFLIERKANYKYFVYPTTLVVLFIITMHNGKGFKSDIPDYVNFFLNKSSIYGSYVTGLSSENLEIGIVYYCKLLHLIGVDSRFGFIFISGLLFLLPFFLLIKKYSHSATVPFILLMTIYATSVLITFMSGYRQMLSLFFILISLYIYLNKIKYGKKGLITIPFLLAISVIFHSSSYYIIPIIVIIYFLPISKYTMYGILISSLILGSFELFNLDFITILDDLTFIERTTNYIINDVYDNNKAAFLFNIPMVALTLIFIYYSTNNELKQIFLKSLFFAITIRTLLGYIPLINRVAFPFIIIGLSGSVPVAILKSQRLKLLVGLILIYHIWKAYSAYTTPGYGMLPYNFIWE